jgi:hypothetical protein
MFELLVALSATPPILAVLWTAEGGARVAGTERVGVVLARRR